MNFFKVDHSAAGGNGFEPVPQGEYEVIVSKAEYKQSQNGNDMIKLELTIRDDVAQEAQKRKLFDNIVFMESMVWKIQQVYKAFGLTDGTVMNDINDVIANLAYKVARVKVKHETYTPPGGEARIQERVGDYAPAHNPLVAPGGVSNEDPFANNQGGSINISDDDLPF